MLQENTMDLEFSEFVQGIIFDPFPIEFICWSELEKMIENYGSNYIIEHAKAGCFIWVKNYNEKIGFVKIETIIEYIAKKFNISEKQTREWFNKNAIFMSAVLAKSYISYDKKIIEPELLEAFFLNVNPNNNFEEFEKEIFREILCGKNFRLYNVKN